MTFVLDQTISAEGIALAVVSRQRVETSRHSPLGVGLYCSKEPAYVVIGQGANRQALDMRGEHVSLVDVAELCPAVTSL